MKIQLIESEIKEALQKYLCEVVSISEDKEFNIEILATRGATGVTAEVTIEAKNNNVQKTVVEPVKVETKPVEVVTIPVAESAGTITPTPAKKSLFAGMDIK
jgi:hypothetical protein